jgi:glycosyltransferase involved in cell wall biosynthesis
MDPQKISVLVVGQTPPPIHGQAVMIQALLDGEYDEIELHHVRMCFSRSFDEAGAFRVRKLLVLLRTLIGITIGRWRSRAQILYYPPAGPMLNSVIRDIVLLICTRWLFEHTIFHFHAAGLPEFCDRLPRWLRPFVNLAYRSADLAIFVSESSASAGHEFAAKEVAVIPNGIPDNTQLLSSDLRERKDDATHLLFMGILCEGKGLLTLIKACAQLRKAGLSFHLVCAGAFASEGFKNEVEQLIESEGLRDAIEFPGVLSGMEKWHAYHNADVFCFPSHYQSENFPVVLIEAMSFGLPIVTTRWRGIPDVVGGAGGAFIVEPRQPRLVAESLRTLMRDAELRASMGRKNRARFCDHFTLPKFRTSMKLVLQKVGSR